MSRKQQANCVDSRLSCPDKAVPTTAPRCANRELVGAPLGAIEKTTKDQYALTGSHERILLGVLGAIEKTTKDQYALTGSHERILLGVLGAIEKTTKDQYALTRQHD